MKISIIAAVADNGVIGVDNRLPWHLGADMKHFKTITTGHTILMGKNTYLSIGKALPNRRNIILSHSLKSVEGCEVIASVDDLSKLGLADEEELIVIGGAHVYNQLLAKADNLYLTYVHVQADGNVRFPEIDLNHWHITYKEMHRADDKNDYDYTFVNYERKK